jgi:hypothetical protein
MLCIAPRLVEQSEIPIAGVLGIGACTGIYISLLNIVKATSKQIKDSPPGRGSEKAAISYRSL